MAERGVYVTLLRASVAGQLAYRRSFALEVAGQGLVVLVDLVEVIAVFTQVRALGGFRASDVLVVFGLSGAGYALADLAVGQTDDVARDVRRGTFDVLLVRPLPVLAQLATRGVQLRRLGRLAVAVLVLVLALRRAGVRWTPARAVLLAVSPLAGAVLFGALFVASGALSFWLVDGREVGNALVYGSNYVSHWPVGVLGLPLSRFFTFVVPAAFTGYLPALVLLDRPEPGGLPGWLGWMAPLAAVAAAGAATLLWRAGVRRYVGAGG